MFSILRFNLPRAVTLKIIRFWAFFALLFAISFNGCTSDSNIAQKSNVTASLSTALRIADEINDQGRTNEAINYLQGRYRRISDPSVADRFSYYSFVQSMYSRPKLTNQDSALQYADSMVLLFRETGADASMTKELAQALFARGDALYSLGRFQEAYRAYYKGSLQSVNGNDPCTEASYSYRIGMVLFRQARFPEAIQAFRNSLNKIDACQGNFTSFYRHQELLSNIGLSYCNLNLFDSAVHAYSLGLDYIEENRGRFPNRQKALDAAKGVILGNWGEVYRRQGKMNKAEQLFLQSIAINEQPGGEQIDAARTRLSLARIYLANGRYEKVVDLIRQVQKSRLLDQDKASEAGISDILWRYFAAVGDRQSAFTELQRYSKLNSDVLEHTLKVREGEVRDQVQRIEKENELASMYRNSVHQKSMLYGAMILLLLCLFSIALVYFYWTRSKRHVSNLTELHSVLRQQKVQLEDALIQLEDEARDKDRILRMVVHDLRNPIASVVALTDILKNGAESGPEERTEFLMLIEQACSNSLELINEILAATSQVPKSGVLSPVDFSSIVKSSTELLRFKAAEKNQSIRLIQPDNPVMVSANNERMWRVVNNLITNAIKFSNENSSIDVVVESTSKEVILGVYDSGIGIPLSMQDKIFDLFTEAKRYGTANEKPFGLGLAISKQIVEEHGGRISFKSEENEGASFFVHLPHAAAPAANTSPEATSKEFSMS